MTDASRTVKSIVLTGLLMHHRVMKVLSLLSGLGLTIAACAPLTIYHRPGVAVTRMQTDQTRCEIAALRDAPVANQIRQRPPIFVPGRQICGAAGCQYFSGYWVEGGIYTVDVNAGLRGRAEGQCMARRGYQPVTVPLCTATVKAQVAPRQTRILPVLSETACSIRYDDGAWQIVNPVFAPQ